MTVSQNKRLEVITPNQGASKAMGAAPASNFDSFLGAVDAMTPMGTELMAQGTGSYNAAAVLHGAFTGMTGAAGAYGYGQTSTGLGTGYGGFGALSEYPGIMGAGSAGSYTGYVAGSGYGAKGIAGTDVTSTSTSALQTSDLMNSMNTNNLKLLELQATMQSNMQQWNTRSNILSADHKMREGMINNFRISG